MALLKETTIEGDFLAEDTIIDLNEAIGGAQDPDAWFTTSTNGIYGGIRIDRGSATPALAAWNEQEDRWEVGLEGSTERVLTESDLSSITAEANLEEGTNVNFGTNASTGATIINAVPSGSDNQVQFNDNGVFGADSNLTFDGNRLFASGGVDISNQSTFRIASQDVLYLDWNSGSQGFALGPSATDHVKDGSDPGNIFIRAEDNSGSYTLTSSGTIIIGDRTTTDVDTNNNTITGYAATENVSFNAGPENAFYGYAAGKDGNGFNRFVAVGALAAEGSSGSQTRSIAIGHSALRQGSGNRITAVGADAGRSLAGGSGSVFLGAFAGKTEGDYTQASAGASIAIGSSSFTTASGQLAIGAPADKGTSPATITDVFVGKGVEATSPTEITIHGTDAQVINGVKNADAAGADITIATGRGAGAGSGAEFSVKTAEPNTTSYQQHSLVERLRIDNTGFYVTQAPPTVSTASELLTRDSGTGELQSVAVSDLNTGATYTATTTGNETQTLQYQGGPKSYLPGTATNFEIHVVAQVDSITSASLTNATEGDTHMFEIEGSAVNRAGSLVVVGEPDVNSISYDVPVNGLSVDVSATGNELQVQVTGIQEVIVDWAATIEDTEVSI